MAAPLKLTRTHRILIGLVITGAVVIAAIGFTGSYSAVRALAARKGFGSFSLVFPIGIDAGICVLLALDLLLTWIRIPFPMLRQTAWLLTAATIAFNGAAAWPDPLGVGMHAVIPVLFVVAVEAARHAVGRIADITADKHMEGVRITRWLLSPIPTFLLWRRMKLWELRSYEATIKLEQERLVYQARLHSRFGRGWRRKAPVESLMPLRLARYGVPLAETAPAGLAAAGIEPTLLPPKPAATAELERPADTSRGERARPQLDGAQAAPQHQSADTGADGQSPWFNANQVRPHTYDGGYDPSYEPDAQYERWYVQQEQQYAEQQQAAGPHHAWQGQYADQQHHAAQAQQQQHYADPSQAAHAAGQPALNGTVPHQDPAGQLAAFAPSPGSPGSPDAGTVPDHSIRVPAGPGRTRPLGGNTFPIPSPRTEQSARQHEAGPAGHAEYAGHAEHNGHAGEPVNGMPQAAHAPTEPMAEPGAEDEPQPGATLPDGQSRNDAYFDAFRRYIREHSDFPNARQFGLYLQSLYNVVGQSGGPLTEGTLRPYLKDFRDRYQRELDAEADADAVENIP